MSNHRGHRSSLALVLAPMFELRGESAEHTFYTYLHREALPRHLTTNGTPILFLALTAVLPTGQEQNLFLDHIAEKSDNRFCQYRVFNESRQWLPEPLPAGTEIRFRVRDISGPADRRWRLQLRWPFLSRPYRVSQAALVVLIY